MVSPFRFRVSNHRESSNHHHPECHQETEHRKIEPVMFCPNQVKSQEIDTDDQEMPRSENAL